MVLGEQTLEINSVVKDSTSPSPSLVKEVQYPSLTILQQLQVTHPLEKRDNAQFLRFSSRMAHCLNEGSSIWPRRRRSEGVCYWDSLVGAIMPFMAYFWCGLDGQWFIVSVARFRLVKERNFWRGSIHLEGKNTILQQGNSSIMFLDLISIIPKGFGWYWS